MAERPIKVSNPIGKGVLEFRSMKISETLGRPFEGVLDLYSENGSIKHEDLLGQNITVQIPLDGGKTRYFSGLVSRFEHAGYGGAGAGSSYTRYGATLVPALWFLDLTSDCRIFQGETALDIIKKILRKHDFLVFDEKLSGVYGPRPYCVQYRETDFNFVSRLMEEEGIYYFFTHDEGKHTMVLADAPGSHQANKGYEKIPYYGAGEKGGAERERISEWTSRQEVQTGAYVHTDFDYESPQKELARQDAISRSHAIALLERFDYPGHYVKEQDGEAYAKIRLEAFQANYERVSGISSARGLAAGSKFKLDRYPRKDQNKDYLVVEATYELKVEAPFDSKSVPETRSGYQCKFEAIPATTQYRSPCRAQKPVVRGPQTAVVVGGDEIWTDKYGRVKVKFHWDRHGKSDIERSCWIRVSQPWGGAGWGGLSIPRKDQEVIVDFLEGNPDQPIITGRVYNGSNLPPFGLPGGAMISGIRSNSYPGGGGYNEYAMDDTKGKELIREHAQYDKDSTVKNDFREHVLHDRSRDVTNNETVQIGKDQVEIINNNQDSTIKVNRIIDVGNDHTEAIHGSMNLSVSRTKSETVVINSAESVGGAKELSIGGLYQVTVGGAHNATVGGAKTEEVGAFKGEVVAGAKTVAVGGNHSKTVGGKESVTVTKDRSDTVNGKFDETVKKEYTLKAKKITVQAEDEIIIKVGKAQIAMKKNGEILVQGKDLNSKATGKINQKASGDIILKGSKIKEN